MAIKFKHKQIKNAEVEYIECSNLIIPIKSIIYIEHNILVSGDKSYTIYFDNTLSMSKDYYGNDRDYKLGHKTMRVSERGFNKFFKTILEDKCYKIER